MLQISRRAFPLAITQCAAMVSVALVWSAARSAPAAPSAPSGPTETSKTVGGVNEAVSPLETPTHAAASRRTLPLPTPSLDERAWLDEWRDLITMTTRKAAIGC